MVRLGQGIRESLPILQMVPMAATVVVGISNPHQPTILWNSMDDTIHGILAHPIFIPALLILSDSPHFDLDSGHGYKGWTEGKPAMPKIQIKMGLINSKYIL